VNSIIVAVTFLGIAAAFVAYDIAVQHRNAKLVSDAARSNAIVTQLFPGDIADKMFNRPKPDNKDAFKGTLEKALEPSRPLADLHLEASVMFAGRLTRRVRSQPNTDVKFLHFYQSLQTLLDSLPGHQFEVPTKFLIYWKLFTDTSMRLRSVATFSRLR
jgi:hypothetical protein